MTPEDKAIRKRSFEISATKTSNGVFHEVVFFLVRTKKWWLLPIILALALIGVIAVLGTSSGAPFIYALF